MFSLVLVSLGRAHSVLWRLRHRKLNTSVYFGATVNTVITSEIREKEKKSMNLECLMSGMKFPGIGYHIDKNKQTKTNYIRA